MEKTIKRNKLIDICKGIGIISIVIGHASWNIPIGNIDIPIGPFVYLYHLAIFFFCSGFLYKKEENDWGEFLKKKIKALYFPFVIYSVSFLLFRNFFINLGILAGEKTTIGSFVISMTNILTFNSLGEFLSAFWFLPVMFITMLLYTAIFMYTRKLKDLYSDIVINITGKNQNADKNSPKLLNVRIFVIEITKLPIVVFSPAKIPKLIKKFLKSKNETEYITNGKYNAFIFFFKNSPQSFSSFLYKKPEQKKKIAK